MTGVKSPEILYLRAPVSTKIQPLDIIQCTSTTAVWEVAGRGADQKGLRSGPKSSSTHKRTSCDKYGPWEHEAASWIPRFRHEASSMSTTLKGTSGRQDHWHLLLESPKTRRRSPSSSPSRCPFLGGKGRRSRPSRSPGHSTYRRRTPCPRRSRESNRRIREKGPATGWSLVIFKISFQLFLVFF